jgi:hypothetical protein
MKPHILVTRKLPAPVETRIAALFEAMRAGEWGQWAPTGDPGKDLKGASWLPRP